MMKRIVVSIVSLIMITTTASCAAINVNSLPALGGASGYDVTIEFSNVLNLPGQAKVMMDGVQVGLVRGVAVAKGRVDVNARINNGVVIPSNVRAILQQATVLGDIYVALERDTDSPIAGRLRPGGTIPVERTTSPPPLEDTLARLAMFIGSGSIQRLQNTVIGINRAMPPEEDIRKIASQVATDLSDLSNNIDVVDQMLNGLSGTAAVMRSSIPKFQVWVSPEGQKLWFRVLDLMKYVSILLPSFGSVYTGGYWLVPFFNSFGNALDAVTRSKRAIEHEIPAWRRLFTDYFLPQDKYPAINITSVIGPDGRELLPNVHDVLRIIGAMP